jgi:hypothetical protein
MLVERVAEDIAKALDEARKVAAQINRGAGGREMALTITKLEEALMWLAKVPEV